MLLRDVMMSFTLICRKLPELLFPCINIPLLSTTTRNIRHIRRADEDEYDEEEAENTKKQKEYE